MAKVGTLTLDTDINTAKFEAKIRKLENKAEQSARKVDEAFNKRDLYSSQFDRAIENVEMYERKLDEAQEELQLLDDKLNSLTGHKVITGDMITQAENIKSKMADQRELIEDITNKLNKERDVSTQIAFKLNQQENAIKKQQEEYENVNNELTIQKKKQEELNKINGIELPKMDEGLGNIIKRITKIGLGLIGLRTGLSFLRSSISTVSSQNDEIATKINSIKTAIANALTPAVQVVVGLFAKLLAYIGYILRSWFGIDIFAKNTANNTKKMKNNIGGANKEANKLKRTLAGFDEMNILQKDGGVSSGGGGGGISNEDLDMSMFQSVPIPEWVQWIADNKDGILNTLLAIAGAIGAIWVAIKTITVIEKLVSLGGVLGKIFTTLSSMSGLQIFGMIGGIAITIAGLIDLISSIADGTITLSSALKDLGIIIDGVAIAMIAFNATNPVGWIALVIGAVMTLTGVLGEEEQQTLDLTQAKKDLYDAELKYVNSQKKYVQAVKDKEKAQKDLIATEKKNKMSGEELYKLVLTGKKTYEQLTPKQKETYLAYMNLLGAEASLKQANEELQKTEKEQILSMIQVQAANAKTEEDYQKLGKTMEEFIDSGKISASDLEETIKKKYNSIDEYSKALFVTNMPKSITSTSKEVKNLLNYVEKLKKKFDELHKGTQVGGTRFYVSGYGSYYAKGGIVGYAKGGVVNIPKLAPGGLINRPGPGVAIGGEKGTEGVIPLTDSQQMSRLGRAIGRFINIKAEVPVYVGNRQIAREIRDINQEESFAFNG